MTGTVASGRPGLARTATALTAARLLLVVPVAVLMARADRGSAVLAAGVLAAAIATDLLDGRAARAAGTAGRRGQIFDHGSDCAFVTAALAGAASREAVPWLLPVLVVVSFVQYVGDSWWLDPSGSLRGNRLGHANGVLYFAPPVIDVLARFVAALAPVTLALAWALVVTTVLSMGQRVRWLRAGRLAPGSRPGGKPDR